MKRDVWQAFRYFLQLLLSLAAPPVGLSLLARWGCRHLGLAAWVGAAALTVGIGISMATLVSLLRAFRRIERGRGK